MYIDDKDKRDIRLHDWDGYMKEEQYLDERDEEKETEDENERD